MDDPEQEIWPIEGILGERVNTRGKRQLQVQWAGLTCRGTRYKPEWICVDDIAESIVKSWEHKSGIVSTSSCLHGYVRETPIPLRPRTPIPVPTIPSWPGNEFACDDKHVPFRLVQHTKTTRPCQGARHPAHRPHHVCEGCHKSQLAFFLDDAEANHMIKDNGTFPLCSACVSARFRNSQTFTSAHVNDCICLDWLCAECWIEHTNQRTRHRSALDRCLCGNSPPESNDSHVRVCSGCYCVIMKESG